MVNRIKPNGLVLPGIFTMKKFEEIFESIIIVLLFIIIVLPEIAYSYLLRLRDWVEDTVIDI